MLIAHISDLHIRPHGVKLYDFIDTNALISQHVATINMLAKQHDAPDALIVTGDIVNCGTPDEYKMARRILGQVTIPLYLIPGNHDNNASFLDALSDLCPPLQTVKKGKPNNIHYILEDFPIRFVLLDSTVDGELGGLLGDTQLAWLDEQLTQDTNKETVICMHHHPVPCGNAHMDAILCADGHKLMDLLKKHPHVTRVICGHTHRVIFQAVNGITVCTAPGSAHQVPFHSTDLDGSYTLEPPAMYMHRYSPETGLVTYSQALLPFAGPYPFDSACACPEGGI